MPHSIFGVMKDVKAFIRFLLNEELLDRHVEPSLPGQPDTLVPVWTREALDRVWQTPQLTYKGVMGKRNRAVIGLMFDTGLR